MYLESNQSLENTMNEEYLFGSLVHMIYMIFYAVLFHCLFLKRGFISVEKLTNQSIHPRII